MKILCKLYCKSCSKDKNHNYRRYRELEISKEVSSISCISCKEIIYQRGTKSLTTQCLINDSVRRMRLLGAPVGPLTKQRLEEGLQNNLELLRVRIGKEGVKRALEVRNV